MDQEAIIQYITDTFTGLEIQRPTDGPGAGDTFIFYDPQQITDPAHRLPFATIVTKDYGEFDNSSQLDRPDVFRLNIGVSKDAFQALLGYPPSEFSEKSADYDFAALDRVMPHPIYATQSWICVLNPGAETWEAVKPLLVDAYSKAAAQYEAKQAHRE